jgi:hypothetical protein
MPRIIVFSSTRSRRRRFSQETDMSHRSKFILILSFFATIASAQAQAESANDRLMIVNGNSGHVIYDDGRDDLFCVTRRHLIGYDYHGRRVFRRSMHCR